MPPGIPASAPRTPRRPTKRARIRRAAIVGAALVALVASGAAHGRSASSSAPVRIAALSQNAYAALAAASPFASLASSTSSGPLAQFSRVTYDDTPSSSDARASMVVLQRGWAVANYVAQLRRDHPGIKILAYQALWWMRPSDIHGYSDCLTGTGTYPESWFLHDSHGAREVWNTGTSNLKYAMDFGNAAYLSACVKNMVADVKATGADGVFLDGAPSSLHWSQLRSPCAPSGSATCASDANFQAAMTHALAAVTAQMHANGLIAVANISGGNVTFCCGGGPKIWDQYVSQLDGSMQEAWTYGTNHLPLPATEVIAGLGNTAWSEAHHKYVMLNDDITNCQACSLYGLAAMMLVAGGYSSYDIANGIYTGTSNGVWWPSYTTAQAVGTPLAAYATLADGLMVRRFSAHTVLVNDTTAAINDPSYGTVAATSALIR